ncbi:Ubiquitin-conjugating enzyme [Penicillium angulare]|uniref:Ubiquitin-conjugating enzyme n=1 Tax=Penicillium angulare TaxID=116970 RepID=A0A9W9EKP8_9EURO|nr:Ubiquitin-conjugating enzyme [Penicillium angulare]
MTSPSTKRLLKESTDLHKNPSPYFTASPTSDSNLHDWHFTITGPPSPTPYAGGLYHGRITFPPTYPLRPPSFRFLTPSGRFETNREICLSISGHHEETWQPAWGVRTALLAIRSEIMGGESKGQVGGMEGNEEMRRELARVSGQWSCRECGVSNGTIMKEWWEVCAERGVEVDDEAFTGSESKPESNGNANEAKTESLPTPTDAAVEITTQQDDSSTTNHTTPSNGNSQAQPQPRIEAQSPAAAPVDTVDATPASVSSQPLQSTALQHRPAPVSSTTVQPSEPANSPWLDRAIVAVVLALILLMLRRTLDVDDL